MLWMSLALAVAAQNIAPAAPQPKQPSSYGELMSARVPVTSEDINDRPYRVITRVERNVRKATLFSKEPSMQKLENELWERGKKVGADAVINARYGGSRVTAMSWGASKVEGDAIKFLSDAEIVERRGATPR